MFHAEKRREEKGAAEGSGLLRFNDRAWMIGTNKQPFCMCEFSASQTKTSLSAGYR